jgi:hypothetical protein
MPGKKRPNIKDFFSNMQVNIPFWTKIRLALRNNAVKIKTRKDCCGNYGEPGC